MVEAKKAEQAAVEARDKVSKYTPVTCTTVTYTTVTYTSVPYTTVTYTTVKWHMCIGIYDSQVAHAEGAAVEAREKVLTYTTVTYTRDKVSTHTTVTYICDKVSTYTTVTCICDEVSPYTTVTYTVEAKKAEQAAVEARDKVTTYTIVIRCRHIRQWDIRQSHILQSSGRYMCRHIRQSIGTYTTVAAKFWPWLSVKSP